MAETEMVERVARALFEKHKTSHLNADTTETWENMSTFNRGYGYGLARVAIAAMAEAPDHMIGNVMGGTKNGERGVWRDMVRKALGQ